MSRIDPQTVTRLIREVREGDPGAVDALVQLVYSELHAMAVPIFAGQRGDHTLQPTAVVHEAWLKVAMYIHKVEDRTHFYAVASSAMRQVLTDHARRRGRLKRGAERARLSLDVVLDGLEVEQTLDLVELEDSLARLSRLNARHARVVELRLLGGLTIAETAEVLGVGHSTVEGDWFTAKAWLRTELSNAS